MKNSYGLTIILILICIGIYTAFWNKPEPTIEEQIAAEIASQNASIDKQNDLLTEKYQNDMIQCTSSASWAHQEILAQLESCAKMEKPKLQPRVWESTDVISSTGWVKVSGPLRTDLGIPDCRFMNSEHRLRWIPWIAYDLACDKGIAFDVKAPTSESEWVVSSIWYDANCGDYMVLRHGVIYFHYCHTQTSRRIGERVNGWDIVGQTNLSGETTGMHLHVAIVDYTYPDMPLFLSSERYYTGTGDSTAARPLLDAFPTLIMDELKSKPTAWSGWA